MSVSETALFKTEKAAPIKKDGDRSDASLPPRIREKQSMFPYYSMPTREFMRVFADHFPEWILRRRERRLSFEDIIEHHQQIREAYRRRYAGEKFYFHKARRPKPRVEPPLKDDRPPFLLTPGQRRLSPAALKRINNVEWVKPGRTKHVKGAPPMNTKDFIKG